MDRLEAALRSDMSPVVLTAVPHTFMGSLAVLPQRVSVITFKAALTALEWLSLSFMCLLDVGTFQTWTPSCCTWFLILGTLEHYCAFVNVVFVQRISLC